MKRTMKRCIEHYQKRGFVVLRRFPREYVLMYNPNTLDEVRLYYGPNQKVWEH